MLDLDLHDVITKGKQPVSRHLTAREGVVMTWVRGYCVLSLWPVLCYCD